MIIGDYVWLMNPNKVKLKTEKIGPYVILQLHKDFEMYQKNPTANI